MNIRQVYVSEYRAWKQMRGRCNNTNHNDYGYYGARGISVCSRWDSFENFLDDMGEKPGSDYSLNRIDNDKNYTPDNCEWATRIDQTRNRSNTIFVERMGMTLGEFAEQTDLDYNLLYKSLFCRHEKRFEIKRTPDQFLTVLLEHFAP
jgi:hypothetical protein